jgi:hypothetical protein
MKRSFVGSFMTLGKGKDPMKMAYSSHTREDIHVYCRLVPPGGTATRATRRMDEKDCG